MKRVAVVTALVLVLAGIARAGPLVPGHVSADAKWFGHVNFERIRSMQVCQDWKEKCFKDSRSRPSQADLRQAGHEPHGGPPGGHHLCDAV